MRKLTVINHVTLDGVMQAPARPDEDTRGGFSRGGLPIGLEISGPRLGESQVLALAHAYEQATDWHRRTPPQ